MDALAVQELGRFDLWVIGNFGHQFSKSQFFIGIGGFTGFFIPSVGGSVAQKIATNFGGGKGEEWKHRYINEVN
jgi:hypothetical protein